MNHFLWKKLKMFFCFLFGWSTAVPPVVVFRFDVDVDDGADATGGDDLVLATLLLLRTTVRTCEAKEEYVMM